MLSWQWPLVFLLLPLPWLARWLLPAKRMSVEAIRIPHFDQTIISTKKNGMREAGPRWTPILISALTWVLLLTSAAQPVWYGDPITLPQSGRDLMLAVDISDSMKVDDMAIGDQTVMRINAVKSVVADFVDAQDADRIGLILFGQQTYLQVPLTFDHRTVTEQLSDAQPGFAGSSTAIGDALGLAIESLRGRPAQSRVLVLLTDGANTSGSDPIQAATIASEAGIRVHTIGIGALGTLRTYRTGERQGREIDLSMDLDVSLLEQIADLTGGTFFRAHDPAQMRAVYQKISELEPTPEPRHYRPLKSLLHWPLGLAIGLVALTLLTVAGRNRWMN